MPSLMMPVISISVITAGLEKNNCLVNHRLYMHRNPLTGVAIVNIVNSLKVTNTLYIAVLELPECPEYITKTINSQQEVINTNKKR